VETIPFHTVFIINPFACFTPKTGGKRAVHGRLCSFAVARGNELTLLPALPPHLG
jgi:hypothetical protein